MLVYICGPIKGVPDYKERFARAEEKLVKAGHVCVNPAEMDHVLKGSERTRDMFLKLDGKLLQACHAIYLMDGWRESEGARLERMQAVRMGKHILTGEGT